MVLKDEIKIMTADFGFQQYVVILVAGHRQFCDYFQETFIFREEDSQFYYQRRDNDKAPEGTSHEERCGTLLKSGLLDAKYQLKKSLKDKYDLTKELIYYEARKEIDNLKDDYEGWLKYLQKNDDVRKIVAQIRAKTYSDDLKEMLK